MYFSSSFLLCSALASFPDGLSLFSARGGRKEERKFLLPSLFFLGRRRKREKEEKEETVAFVSEPLCLAALLQKKGRGRAERDIFLSGEMEGSEGNERRKSSSFLLLLCFLL